VPPNAQDFVVEIAREAGFFWGGKFSKPDPRHFYVNPPGGRKKAIRDAQKRYKCLINAEECRCSK
jgi:hypothetical protein